MQNTDTYSGASFAAGGLPCLQCGVPLPSRALACLNCGALVFRDRLQQLADEAAKQEWVSPQKAAIIWRQCLGLLPADSEHYREVFARAAALAEGATPIPGSAPKVSQPDMPDEVSYRPVRGPIRKPETPTSILLKTGGSMALSTWVYQIQAGWAFAIGFVLLILIHELGHVIANWYFRIAQSPPVFLPYVGALIELRQNPPDARAEAVMGIAGPVAGTFATLICFAWYVRTGNALAEQLAIFGVFLNLFNLIPCPPMDGGRVAAAISPLLWIPGACLFAAFMIYAIAHNGGANRSIGWVVSAMIFYSAFQRIRRTIFGGDWRQPYYRVDWTTRIGLAIAVTVLVLVLVSMLRFVGVTL